MYIPFYIISTFTYFCFKKRQIKLRKSDNKAGLYIICFYNIFRV